MRPTHVFAADFDGDGLDDVATHLNTTIRVYLASSRSESWLDYDDSDIEIAGPEEGGRWTQNRVAFAREGVVTADFDGDGYGDMATVAWEAGESGNGRAYITSGSEFVGETTFAVDHSGTIIDASGLGDDAILQVALGGDNDHDGRPDLWIVGADHEVDASTEHARFFSGSTIVGAGIVDIGDSDATWRPPESEYSGTAERVWVAAPGDLDGDGFEDAFLGATGQIWLITTVER